MIKPSKPPQGARGKPYNRPSLVGNAPLLVLRTTFPPKGALLPALCYGLIMGANVEWRANFPLRGRCRRQKGCISYRRSLVGMFSLTPQAWLSGFIKRGGHI